MLAETPDSRPEQKDWLDNLIEFVRGPSEKPSYTVTRWICLRCLGLIYFFAFGSLWVQILGLVGSNGIAPVSAFMDSLQRRGATFWQVPTLLWLNSSDSALTFLCAAGTLLSVLVIFDVLTGPALALLWLFYLSLFYGGQVFLGFQWDILLLEVGFLAIFFAPWHVLPNRTRQGTPSRIVVWLYRIALFRLLLESGYVKLASGDPTWSGLTATTYHYWTQPLPTPLAWYMNQLPLAFHKGEVLITFFVELIVPFLIFAPRRIRFIAAGLIAGHKTLILLTGNYTFFNFLTIAMYILLLDDTFLQRFLPRGITVPILDTPQPTVPRWRLAIFIPLALFIGILNLVQLSGEFQLGVMPTPAIQLSQQVGQFFIVNGYGLFASMTTSRPEIIVEGSNDGQNWLPYEFKYKAGDLARAPAWIEPYQPRLDWQMWFAALEGSPNVEGWFPTFARRLLEGSPQVLALLDKNPFPDKPPHYIRAELYNYRFTDFATRQATGNWWQREPAGEFFPPSTLADLK